MTNSTNVSGGFVMLTVLMTSPDSIERVAYCEGTYNDIEEYDDADQDGWLDEYEGPIVAKHKVETGTTRSWCDEHGIPYTVTTHTISDRVSTYEVLMADLGDPAHAELAKSRWTI